MTDLIPYILIFIFFSLWMANRDKYIKEKRRNDDLVIAARDHKIVVDCLTEEVNTLSHRVGIYRRDDAVLEAEIID